MLFADYNFAMKVHKVHLSHKATLDVAGFKEGAWCWTTGMYNP